MDSWPIRVNRDRKGAGDRAKGDTRRWCVAEGEASRAVTRSLTVAVHPERLQVTATVRERVTAQGGTHAGRRVALMRKRAAMGRPDGS